MSCNFTKVIYYFEWVFLVKILGVSIYSIMRSANNKSFTSSFLAWMPLIRLSCLIAVARTYSTMLTRNF